MKLRIQKNKFSGHLSAGLRELIEDEDENKN